MNQLPTTLIVTLCSDYSRRQKRLTFPKFTISPPFLFSFYPSFSFNIFSVVFKYQSVQCTASSSFSTKGQQKRSILKLRRFKDDEVYDGKDAYRCGPIICYVRTVVRWLVSGLSGEILES